MRAFDHEWQTWRRDLRDLAPQLFRWEIFR